MARSKDMAELRELVRRLRRGESLRGIRRQTGVHRETLCRLRAVSAANGWLDETRSLPRRRNSNGIGRGNFGTGVILWIAGEKTSSAGWTRVSALR